MCVVGGGAFVDFIFTSHFWTCLEFGSLRDRTCARFFAMISSALMPHLPFLPKESRRIIQSVKLQLL
jgi:hypothetical protein